MFAAAAHSKSLLPTAGRTASLLPSYFDAEPFSLDPALIGGTWEIEADPTAGTNHTVIRFFDDLYIASDGCKTSFGRCIADAAGPCLKEISVNTPNGRNAEPGEFFQWLSRVTNVNLDEDDTLWLTTEDGQTLTAIRRWASNA